jgi:aryl-alcohol dehydrogenase-like predicted oxidoreductase
MQYRKTRDGLLEVSVVGVGTYAYSGVYGKKDPAVIKQVLRAAYDRGVTMFDTAPAYGEAEVAVGEALRDVRPNLVISTKVPARLDDLSSSYDTIVSACEMSLERLGMEYIDLYQVHFDDGTTPVEETIRAFEDLRADGKIRAYGIGHMAPERAAEYVGAGSPSTIMGELNAVSRTYYMRMLPVLKESEVGYVGFSLTGRGILTEHPVDREHLAPDDIRQMDAVFAGERRRSALRIKDEFHKVGSDLGATAQEVAISWAIAQENVLTGLIGPTTLEHLDQDVRAAEVELDASTRDHLDGFLVREATRLETGLRDEVIHILRDDITDTKGGASRLIYAMEGLAELELAREEDLVSSMGKVIKIMKGVEGGLSDLDAIRRDLFHHVSAR